MRLAITNLQVSFGERRVVDLADLAVGEAEIVGLAGDSGSGKSMTTLAVLGLAHTVGARVSGSIRLDGTELTGLSHREMREVRGRRIAAIFQSPALAFSPVYRVGSIVHRALRLHGMTRTEAAEAAERAMRQVLLPPGLLDRYPSQLSGGQLTHARLAMRPRALPSRRKEALCQLNQLAAGEDGRVSVAREVRGHRSPHSRGAPRESGRVAGTRSHGRSNLTAPACRAGQSHRRKIRFGSIRSRRPSPSKVKANAVTRIAIPGKVTTHQEVRK